MVNAREAFRAFMPDWHAPLVQATPDSYTFARSFSPHIMTKGP